MADPDRVKPEDRPEQKSLGSGDAPASGGVSKDPAIGHGRPKEEGKAVRPPLIQKH